MNEGPTRRIRIIETPQQRIQREEMLRRGELRRNALVPINVMWTSSVPQPEARAALAGVMDVVRASGQNRQVVSYGSSQFARGEYSSADWYVQQAQQGQQLRRDVGYGPQLDPSEVTALLGSEPWQAAPHWEVVILNSDLNSRTINGQYLNFVFGVTEPSFASVQSVTRLMREIQDPILRQQIVRRLLRHEVGHMFGLPSGTRGRNLEESLGTHCTNVCTMRQGLSTQEWIAQNRQEQARGVQFCGDCTADLARSRPRYRPLTS